MELKVVGSLPAAQRFTKSVVSTESGVVRLFVPRA